MLQKNSRLIELKEALASIPHAGQRIATTAGLLASSGLNPSEQMPEMCRLLQKFFDLASCGFFWADKEGNMQDAWCLAPDFLSFRTLMSCLEYQASGTRTWPTFQENVLIGPVAGYLLPFQNERFYASPHFLATYQAINVRHILDVVLHDGTRPFGAFLLMRSSKQGPFTPDERKLLEEMIPILNKAFSTPHVDDTNYSEKEMTGFALVGRDGKWKSMSDEARRIVWMLTHHQPGSFADSNDPPVETHLERLVAMHKEQFSSGEQFSSEMENQWGKFGLSLEQEPKTLDLIVTLRRKVPLASRLALCLAGYNWPPMRQMVAWLLAQGLARNQIATELGNSVETVTSHIKLIYRTTDTSSSHGLLLKLAG